MKKQKDEPIWCKMYREQVLKPKQRQRITEQKGRTKESQSGFYNSKAWKQLRARHIAEHPICVECEKEGKIRPATVVDHRIPVDEDQTRSLDSVNLQSLCDYHHIRKTNADKARRNKEKRLEAGRKLMKQFEQKYTPGRGVV
jgi:5-methylcytosine-specific restriction endonuclease McrA